MTDICSILPSIELAIKEELAASNTPGLGVGLVHDGALVFGKGYGLARVDEQAPVSLDTVFKWGSISKPFTCIAFFQLWEKGMVHLDDKVNDYLKNGWIRKKHETWPDITFKHLLTHTSGIGEARRFTDIFYPGFRLLTYDNKPVPPMSTFHELPQYAQSPAGQKYAYSNIGGSILGYVIELVSGESFQDYMVHHVLEPLGMHNSDFDRSERVNHALAAGYKYKKGMLVPAKPWNNIIKPSGGLHASLEDMSKFVACMLNKGELNGTRLLKRDTVELIWKPHYWAHESFKETNSIGFIFRVGRLNERRVVWHTGGLSGFTSTMDLFPDENTGLYLVANLSETLHHRITLRLRHRLLKLLTNAKQTLVPTIDGNKAYWKDIKGYYGPYPGWLANTRTILDGVDFKISEKEDHLVFSSLFGENQKGIKLNPTNDPLVYQYPAGETDYADYMVKLGVTLNKDGVVSSIGMDLHEYRKNRFLNTARFKIYVLIATLVMVAALSIAMAFIP